MINSSPCDDSTRSFSSPLPSDNSHRQCHPFGKAARQPLADADCVLEETRQEAGRQARQNAGWTRACIRYGRKCQHEKKNLMAATNDMPPERDRSTPSRWLAQHVAKYLNLERC